MGLDQYIFQSSADADVLNTINAIIDIDFESGQIVEELTYLRGYHSLHDYFKWVTSTIQNETFTPITAAAVITYRDFCWRVMQTGSEGTIWDDSDAFYVRDFEAESIYERLSEALEGMDINLKLYYYASY